MRHSTVNPAGKARRAVALLGVTAMLLGGCVQLPRSGPVNDVQPRAADDSQLVQQALGPVPGAQPQAIVSGFLRACAAGTYDDYQVAKQYLTKSAAALWNPTEGVIVGKPNVQPQVKIENAEGKENQPTAVAVSFDTQGTVDRLGVYQPQDALTEQRWTLQRDLAGQWRIAQLPSGVLVPNATFNTTYTRRKVYFIGPDQRTLIPDPRFLPRRRLAAHLLNALLAGPSAGLSPAVTTGFPPGTTVGGNGLSVRDNVAAVELSGNVMDATAQQQAQLQAQVSRTFEVSTDVTSVVLSSDAGPLVVTQEMPLDQLNLGRYVGFTDAGLVEVSANGTTTIANRSLVEQLRLADPALGPATNTPIAVVSGGKTLLALTERNGFFREVLKGTALSAPSVDRWGWIWTTQDSATQPLLVARADGVSAKVALQVRDRLEQVRISPDGIHFGALIRSGAVYSVVLGVVVRDAKGMPLRVDSLRTQELGENSFRDIQWATPTTIAAFASGAAPLIKTVEVQGAITEINTPSDAVSLFSGGPGNTVGVLLENGQRMRHVGDIWRPEATDIVSARYPG